MYSGGRGRRPPHAPRAAQHSPVPGATPGAPGAPEMGGSGVAEEKAAVAAAGPSLGPKLQRPRVLFISIFETLSVAVVVQREGGEGERDRVCFHLHRFQSTAG